MHEKRSLAKDKDDLFEQSEGSSMYNRILKNNKIMHGSDKKL